MRKIYVLTLLVYALLVLHNLEEMLRMGSGDFDPSIFIALIGYPCALIGMYLHKRWGFWLALILNAITAILVSLSHFDSASHDYIALSYSYWGGILGVLSAAIGGSVSLLSVIALILGLKNRGKE